MKHFSKVLIAFCLFGFGTTIQAQNSNPASGGNATGTGGTVSYSVGQVAFAGGSGTSGSIIAGVQQPIEISVITGTEKTLGITLELSVYPNPASGFVTLKVESYDTDFLSYRLYDMNSKLFQNGKVEGTETQIQLNNLLPGTYILKIVENNKEIKTFKIIKK